MISSWILNRLRSSRDKVMLELYEIGYVEHHDELMETITARTDLTEEETLDVLDELMENLQWIDGTKSENGNFHRVELNSKGKDIAEKIPQKEKQNIRMIVAIGAFFVSVISVILGII